jgi:hypothetical protein
LKTGRERLTAFFMACSEAISRGKKDRASALKVIGKYMRVHDTKRINLIYEASIARMPTKPFPREEAIRLEIENIAFTEPQIKGRKPSEFMDKSILSELEAKGFFVTLHH